MWMVIFKDPERVGMTSFSKHKVPSSSPFDSPGKAQPAGIITIGNPTVP